MSLWIRVCQSCNYKQQDTKPTDKGMTPAYQDRKCKSCGSRDFDYGSENWEWDGKKYIRKEQEEQEDEGE